jgi:hypothetical protein
MNIDRENGLNAIYGGLLLGGGGGGILSEGIKILDQVVKLGGIKLHSIDEMENDSIVATASLVGSPSSKDKFVGSDHYKRVYELFGGIYDKPVQGIVTNELGAQSITNGWMLSAMTGIPFMDAPCNGRAHPTGSMGSLGLSRSKDYVSVQVCAGGKGDSEIEVTVKSTLSNTSKIIRNSAVAAGGFVTVLRNPVTAEYVKEQAAVGGIEAAIKIGSILRADENNIQKTISDLRSCAGLEVLCEGVLTDVILNSRGGFDVGECVIKSKGSTYTVSLMNEYMTAEKDGVRIATFPDLIAIFDKKTSLPVISAEITRDMEVVLVKIPSNRLILGISMFDIELFKEVEHALGKNLTDYVFGKGKEGN